MWDATFRRSSTAAGFTVGAVMLVVVCAFAGGCGTAAGGGSTEAPAPASAPPIDLLAPTDFETASFALG